VADDTDDLAGRLDRIEELLRRRAGLAPAAAAGPEVRSARSIVSRIDDVWVAVTEGNERVIAAIADVHAGARPAAAEADDPAVHLRLNRIEEALAGIAGRLADPGAGADAAGAGAIEGLGAEVRRLAQQVEAMARAVEAAAPRWGDGTVGDRLGRLRDQFRR